MHAASLATWLRTAAPLLDAGHELLLPVFLPHPSAIGFAPASLAPFGQARDWVYETIDGRLVIHEMANGQCIIRFERSPLAALAQLLGVAEAGVAMLARGLVEIGARL